MTLSNDRALRHINDDVVYCAKTDTTGAGVDKSGQVLSKFPSHLIKKMKPTLCFFLFTNEKVIGV